MIKFGPAWRTSVMTLQSSQFPLAVPGLSASALPGNANAAAEIASAKKLFC